MTMPRIPSRGGFRRPFKLGEFIRDELVTGRITWASELYGEYKVKMESIPLSGRNKNKTRKVISITGFFVYLYALRRLGLIEYVDQTGNPVSAVKVKGLPAIKGQQHVINPGYYEFTDPAGKVISGPAPTTGLYGKLYFHMVPGMGGDPAWGDPMQAAGYRS